MNIILEHRFAKNTKLNKLAKIGYFCTATYDPYGLTSLICAFIMWSKGARNKQWRGFVASMVIHIIATAVFDKYFNSLIDTIIYGVIFETILPITLYRITKAPTTELLEAPAFTSRI